jgi:hypothetical protein
MLGTLLVAVIAVAAIVLAMLTIRANRRREWLEHRVRQPLTFTWGTRPVRAAMRIRSAERPTPRA